MVRAAGPRPVVGLTCYVEPANCRGRFDVVSSIIPHAYVQAITAGGARCVILPPDDDTSVLERLDALVIAGGPDVDPRLYGAEHGPRTDPPREARDSAEIALTLAALATDLPLLGICRGLQIMAVACGGTLHQHLPDLLGSDLHRGVPGSYGRHGARFRAGSQVATILGERLVVPTSHHQAVDDPGSLRVTGWADDDTIEVLEQPDNAFAIGVQWHPEVATDRRLFTALAEAGRRAHAARAGCG